MNNELKLTLLGKPCVIQDGGPLTGLVYKKSLALLGYLAVTGRAHSREALAGLLWGRSPEANARASLRKVLADLRRKVPSHLAVTRQEIAFDRKSPYWLDVEAFDRRTVKAIGRRDGPLSDKDVDALAQAIDLYQGDFAEGFYVHQAPAFEEWVLLERERLRLSALRALHVLAGHHAAQGAYAQAITYTGRLLALEPAQEEAQRQMMALLALDGDREAALRQYQTCRRVLAQELGVEPQEETTALYERIRDGALREGAFLVLARHPPPLLLSRTEESAEEQPVFVGRQRELDKMDRFLDDALRGRGRMVFVTGEPGSGKTALIGEFARRAMAAHRDLVVAGGTCNAHSGIGDPYLPFLEILQLLTGDVETPRSGGALTQEQARRLWATWPAAAQALVELGPDLLGRFVSGAALLARVRAYVPWPRRTAWRDRLVELVERKAAGPNAAAAQQEGLFEQITHVFQSLSCRQPLVLVLDDLQWADGGSISLLFHLGRRLAGSRILVVGAYRPGELPLIPQDHQDPKGFGKPLGSGVGSHGRHPLASVVHEFQRVLGDIQVDLDRAGGRLFVEALLDSQPNCLGTVFRDTLTRHTDGNPLFTVELLQGLQERGDLVQDEAGRWVEGPELDWGRLPARVEAVIAERIGRLPSGCRDILAVASVQGQVFSAEVVARVRGIDAEDVIHCLSGPLSQQYRLVCAEGVERLGPERQRLSRYRFRHSIFRNYLYTSLDEVERVHLHEAVGNVLETLWKQSGADSGAMATLAPQLARHFEVAGLTTRAVSYLLQAGQRAVRLCADEEAIAYFDRGLALLETLPETDTEEQRIERAQQELALCLALCAPLLAARGYASMERIQASTRACELCQQLGVAPPELISALYARWSIHHTRVEQKMARRVAEQLLDLARREQNPLQLSQAHMALGMCLSCLGETVSGRAHLEQAIDLYDPSRHGSLISLTGEDIRTTSQGFVALTLWALGYPDQALQRSRESLAWAQALDHPHSLAVALLLGCHVDLMRRDVQAVQEHGKALMRLSIKLAVPYYQEWADILHGWAQAQQGQAKAGIAQIRRALAGWRARAESGEDPPRPHLVALLAEAYGRAGQPERGLLTIGEALAEVERTGERLYEAMLHCIKGEVLLAQGGDGAESQAETCFQRAIGVARQQQARSWELRATTSLCRLWQKQGKQEDAHQGLTEIYGWFTEGFDTPDLREARALLETLSHR
jgi:adenylate cyclase